MKPKVLVIVQPSGCVDVRFDWLEVDVRLVALGPDEDDESLRLRLEKDWRRAMWMARPEAWIWPKAGTKFERERIAMVFKDDNLIRSLSVESILDLLDLSEACGASPEKVLKIVKEAMA